MNIQPSPFDARDFNGDQLVGNSELPKSLDLRPFLQPIRDQKKQGSCAAQSAACMKEYQEKFDNQLDRHFSPPFVYNNRKNQDSAGMFCRDLMRVMYKIGAVYEKDYPYYTIESPDDMKQRVPELYEKAESFQIQSYARIYTMKGLKNALYENGPCVIAFPVYNYNSNGKMWIQESPQQEHGGGHAMAVVGYTETSFIIRNSWGSDWCDDGYCYYPFDEWGSHWEVWTTVDELKRIPNAEIEIIDTKDGDSEDIDLSDIDIRDIEDIEDIADTDVPVNPFDRNIDLDPDDDGCCRQS